MMMATLNEQQRQFLRAAADLDIRRLYSYDDTITDKALLREAARLVARKLFDVSAHHHYQQHHDNNDEQKPWRAWQALNLAAYVRCTYAFSLWDVLHRAAELGAASSPAVDARCRLILEAMGHAVPCDFDAPPQPHHYHYFHATSASEAGIAAAESPLHFALRSCGPRTVELLGVHFAARLAPHEDVAHTLASAHPDMLTVLRLRFLDTHHNPALYGRLSSSSRGDGGTLLHAVCANPLATEEHIRLVLRPFQSQVRLLDDKFRTARDLLLLLVRRRRLDGGGGADTSALDATLVNLESLERAAHAADLWCTRTTLLVMRRKGLPRELALRIAKQLRVAV